MASLEAGGFFFITARAMERRASARGFLPGEMSSVRVGQSGRCRHRLPGVISGHANHLRYAEIVGVRWVGFLEGLSNGVCGAEGAQDLIGRAKGAKRLGVRIGHCLTIDQSRALLANRQTAFEANAFEVITEIDGQNDIFKAN
jgi:hypothetical protein